MPDDTVSDEERAAHVRECPGQDCVSCRRWHEGRCIRCGNWPNICGHNLSFKERMKGINTNYIGWSETR